MDLCSLASTSTCMLKVNIQLILKSSQKLLQSILFRNTSSCDYNLIAAITGTNPGEKPQATLTPQTVDNADGSIMLNVKVAGGAPPADKFEWTLPNNAKLSPGGSYGSYRAFWPRVSINCAFIHKLRFEVATKYVSHFFLLPLISFTYITSSK